MGQRVRTSRREFLGMLSSGIMTMGLAPGRIAFGHENPTSRAEPFVRNLIAVLNQQGRRWNASPLSKETIEDLHYAYSQIRPRTHQELALVAALESFLPDLNVRRELVDEYVRRRSGQAGQFPDHPILYLSRWGMPDTQGLMVFTEQFDALIRELTDLGTVHRAELLKKIGAQRVRWDSEELRSLFITQYQGLSAEEISIICGACTAWLHPIGVKYSFYSTMVTRALAMSV